MSTSMPYAIGGHPWPGISKLVEECGEVVQVCGKLLGTGGAPEHWDGSNLRERLTEELADLMAAARFVAEHNDLDIAALEARIIQKFGTFVRWHAAQSRPPEPEWIPGRSDIGYGARTAVDAGVVVGSARSSADHCGTDDCSTTRRKDWCGCPCGQCVCARALVGFDLRWTDREQVRRAFVWLGTAIAFVGLAGHQ